MTVQITIRNVPDDVRDALAARAASRSQSMQEFLLAELTQMAARPSKESLLQRVRQRKLADVAENVASHELLELRNNERA